MENDSIVNVTGVTGLRLAIGHQSRVGKDTFAERVAETHGCHTIAIARGVYDIATNIQEYLGKPVVKDPGLLQFIGVGMRDHYGEDIWINAAIAKIKEIIAVNPDANIIVTDMRFPNEMKRLAAEGFTTVKITRDNRVIDRDPTHISETALADAVFDYHIQNNGPNLLHVDQETKRNLLQKFLTQIDDFIDSLGGESTT